MDSEKNWVKNFEVDVLHTVRGCEALMPHLEKSGTGSIVIIASTNALETFGGADGLQRHEGRAASPIPSSSRSTSAAKGVRVNAVSPGPIYFEGGAWEMIKGTMPEDLRLGGEADPRRPHGHAGGSRARGGLHREPGRLAR